MSSTLLPKIFHLSQDKLGLNETYQAFHKDPLFYVLCDALYLPHPEESSKIAKDFERTIKKYLSIHRYHFSEKTLKKTLEHAQKHFLNQYGEDESTLKITALIIVEPAPIQPPDDRYFFIAGIGDFKIFEIAQTPQLLFHDSKTPKLPFDLSLKKRFQQISNALGQPLVEVSVTKVHLNQLHPLLIMSYGIYSSLSEEKWISYATDFFNKKNHILRSLSKIKDKEHAKQLLYLSFDTEYDKAPEESSLLGLPNPHRLPRVSLTKGVRFFKWLFKISMVCILGLCILELTHNFPLLSKVRPQTQEHFRSPIREPEMQLNLRSLRRPFRFPFIRERAYFVDMKKSNDRQAMIIEKLNEKIKNQDEAIRDLQIKTYYPMSKLILEQPSEPESNPTRDADKSCNITAVPLSFEV